MIVNQNGLVWTSMDQPALAMEQHELSWINMNQHGSTTVDQPYCALAWILVDYYGQCGLSQVITPSQRVPSIFQSCRETLSNIPSFKSTSGGAQLCQSDPEVWRRYGACLDGAWMSMADRGLIWISMDQRCRGLTWMIADQCGLAWFSGAVG